MINLLFVHGAGASHRSFNWLVEKLTEKLVLKTTPIFFSYDLDTTLPICLEKINELLNTKATPTIVIGHSLGGLLAAGVCDNPHVIKTITISAPLGGIFSAGMFGLMNSKPMFRDLLPYSTILYDIKSRNLKTKKPHLAIVTSHGMPVISEPNDGVVAVSSQMSWETPSYEKFHLNHFEVLMDKEVLFEIENFIE